MTNRCSDGCSLDGHSTNVAVVAYRRPEHLRRCLEALSLNTESSDTKLTVFVDGPRFPSEEDLVNRVAAVAESFTNFRELQIVRRSRNLGLSRSVIDAVDSSLEERDGVIVLEEDLIVSRFFLRFMNEAIELYRNEDSVASIHGYIYPVQQSLPETFFLLGADCLGWATWRSAWSLFEIDGQALLDRFEGASERTRSLFDFNNSYPYLRMLQSQVAGENDSWAIRWYASAFLADRLTLYPGQSLVFHGGSDGSGTNAGTTKVLDVDVTQDAIVLSVIPIEDHQGARLSFETYFRRARSPSVTAKRAATIPVNRLTLFRISSVRRVLRSALRVMGRAVAASQRLLKS